MSDTESMTTNKGCITTQKAAPQPITRRPGVLRILPETLPYYPYCQNSIPSRLHHSKHIKDVDENAMGRNGKVIPNANLHNTSTTPNKSNTPKVSFTFFFFVDSTNRQSLSAIPSVSFWFWHALHSNDGTTGGDIDDDNNNIIINENRVICIPNHPLPCEMTLHDTLSESLIPATIHSATETTQSSHNMLHSMLVHTGFYHLPFLHPKRLPLLRLLNATRVPSIIVVNNCSGRIVTQYGWEAVERECLGTLKHWTDNNTGWIGNQYQTSEMNNYDRADKERCSGCNFESQVVEDWRRGKSGLPFYWHLLSWIL